MGFGVNVERYENNGTICGIEPKLDLLSARAYFSFDVRRSVYKESFTNWLPVYLNKEHGKRSMPWVKRQMSKMIRPDTVSHWDPFYALKILPALMNTMVVRVMKGMCVLTLVYVGVHP